MRNKILGLLLLILCFLSSIQMTTASAVPIYVGVNYDSPSINKIINLPANNYSVYVNVEGDLSYGTYASSIFQIVKESATYFTITVSASVYEISRTIERRLIITESGDYNFSFFLDTYSVGNYLNYEVILTETVIIYQPKTSIIAEAPYGIVFIFLALIGVTIFELKRRRKK